MLSDDVETDRLASESSEYEDIRYLDDFPSVRSMTSHSESLLLHFFWLHLPDLEVVEVGELLGGNKYVPLSRVSHREARQELDSKTRGRDKHIHRRASIL